MHYHRYLGPDFSSLSAVEQLIYTDAEFHDYEQDTVVSDADGYLWLVVQIDRLSHPDFDILSRVRLIQLSYEAQP